MKIDADKNIIGKMNIEASFLNSGCCGMAGYFGYRRGAHYDVSVKAGERVLLPIVRNAGDDTLIIADGFSCRQQIGQLTHRKALHLAEVIQLALRKQSFNSL